LNNQSTGHKFDFYCDLPYTCKSSSQPHVPLWSLVYISTWNLITTHTFSIKLCFIKILSKLTQPHTAPNVVFQTDFNKNNNISITFIYKPLTVSCSWSHHTVGAQLDVGQVSPVGARDERDVLHADVHQRAHVLTDVVPQHGLVLFAPYLGEERMLAWDLNKLRTVFQMKTGKRNFKTKHNS